MKFDKYFKRMMQASSHSWQIVFTELSKQPYVMSIMRCQWETNTMLRMGLQTYFDDIAAVISKDINTEFVKSQPLYHFCSKVFEQFVELAPRAMKNDLLHDDAQAAAEVMGCTHGDDLCLLVGFVALASSSREVESSVRTAILTACSKWTSERLIVVAPK